MVQLFGLVIILYYCCIIQFELQIIGCVVEIHDEVDFIENEAQDGGALYINSFGQLKVFPNATMTFERNKGQ